VHPLPKNGGYSSPLWVWPSSCTMGSASAGTAAARRTALFLCLGEGDELLSLFAGTSHRVQAHREAWADFQLKRRAQRRKELQVGDEVRVEMLGGTSMCARHETRLARGKVTQVHQDGGAQVLVMGCSSPWKVVLPREQVVILRRPCA
jgi:hypothetical protein